MCPTTLILYFGIAAVFAVIAWSFWKHASSINDALQGCGGRRTNMNGGVLDVNGRQVVFYYQASSRNSPSLLRLTLTGNFFAHAVFHAETPGDRIAKNIGLNQEIQLNDPLFDSAVYIECEDRLFIDQLLGSSDARELMVNLLRDFSRLEIDGCRCMLVKTPCDNLPSMSSNAITAAALGMDQLASRLPPVSGAESSATPATDECRRMEKFSIVTALLTAAAGAVLMIWGLSVFEPVMPGRLFVSSLYVSLPIAGLVGYYLFNQLKGLSTSARSFMTTFLLATAGFILCGWGGGMVLNGLMDISMVQAHQCVVTNKWVSHSKNSTTYHVQTSSWSAQFSSYQFSVSYSKYDQLAYGDPCLITTRSGYLGFEWVAAHICTSRSEMPSNQ